MFLRGSQIPREVISIPTLYHWYVGDPRRLGRPKPLLLLLKLKRLLAPYRSLMGMITFAYLLVELIVSLPHGCPPRIIGWISQLVALERRVPPLVHKLVMVVYVNDDVVVYGRFVAIGPLGSLGMRLLQVGPRPHSRFYTARFGHSASAFGGAL